ncbi:MAG: aminoglycoside adenylyltransferase family protein [Pelistega sp.]|nr:aminoglycoside adenylyltransferase family protein [Pelistega sp.]
MPQSIPNSIKSQVSQALGLIQQHLKGSLLGVYLYGSAVDGGLQAHSDIDLLVLISELPSAFARPAFFQDLLAISAPPGEDEQLRALEITVLVHDDIVPWHYPARRELQFGEWQREEIQAGEFEAAMLDPDVAVLLKKVRKKSLALMGPPATSLIEPVPQADFYQVLADTLPMWNQADDWAGEERNILLTLARIWYSAVTGDIIAKDAAAQWAMQRSPAEYGHVLEEARQAYLGLIEDRLSSKPELVEACILWLKDRVAEYLNSR